MNKGAKDKVPLPFLLYIWHNPAAQGTMTYVR